MKILDSKNSLPEILEEPLLIDAFGFSVTLDFPRAKASGVVQKTTGLDGIVETMGYRLSFEFDEKYKDYRTVQVIDGRSIFISLAGPSSPLFKIAKESKSLAKLSVIEISINKDRVRIKE